MCDLSIYQPALLRVANAAIVLFIAIRHLFIFLSTSPILKYQNNPLSGHPRSHRTALARAPHSPPQPHMQESPPQKRFFVGCSSPHGASRLVPAMSTWSMKIQRAPSRHCREARGSMVIRLRPCMIMSTLPPIHDVRIATADRAIPTSITGFHFVPAPFFWRCRAR